MGITKYKNQTTPSTPSSGYTSLYIDSTDKHLKSKDDAGTVIDYTASVSGDYVLATDVLTLPHALLILTGVGDEVVGITSNSLGSIPNGIFGIGNGKPSTTSINIVTEGPITSGFIGLTPGAVYFIGTGGLLSTTAPSTGIVQQVGFALNTTDFYVEIKQPMGRSS